MELDLENGELVEVVKTTRKLEVSELEQLVTTAEGELKSAQEALNAHNEAGTTLNDNVTTAQAAVDQAKSTLERGQTLVGQTPPPVDGGAEGSGGETPDEAPASTEGATPQTETPAENLF